MKNQHQVIHIRIDVVYVAWVHGKGIACLQGHVPVGCAHLYRSFEDEDQLDGIFMKMRLLMRDFADGTSDLRVLRILLENDGGAYCQHIFEILSTISIL